MKLSNESIEAIKASINFLREHASIDVGNSHQAAILQGSLEVALEEALAEEKEVAKTRYQQGQELAEALASSGHTSRTDEYLRGVVETLVKQHRTHQQTAGRVLIDVIAGYAKAADEYGWDGRNEAFVKLSQKIVADNDNGYGLALPYV